MKRFIISLLVAFMIVGGMSVNYAEPVDAATVTITTKNVKQTKVVNLTASQKTQLVKEIEKEINNYKAGKTIKVGLSYANDSAKKNMKSFKISKKQSKLTVSTDLRKKANTRAQEQIKKFSHTRPNGKKWETVYNRKTIVMGENLFKTKGQPTKIDSKFLNWMARYIVYNWHNSASHRKVLTNTAYKYLGAGVQSRLNGNYCEIYAVLHVSKYK